MRKTLTVLTLLVLGATLAQAQETPLWIRRNAISPDGQTIVFSYKGDLFLVPVAGGQARQLTSNRAHETDPVWSPDGKKIVFTSQREGSKDLYVTTPEGGVPTRLTSTPGAETPLAVTPDGTVYFNWFHADLASPGFDGFPGDPAVYKTDLNGSAPKLVTSLTLAAMSFNAKGDLLYEDYKGYEDPLRKHHTSSVTKDIWLYRAPAKGGFTITADGSFTQLSTFKGEDRNPVFAADGDTFYFLSEQDGKTSNIYKSSLSHPETQVQLTFYDKNPVRFLSVARNGTVAYSYNGELYTLEGGKVAITLSRDEDQKEINPMSLRSASSMALSPNGKEIALVMRGDVFVTSVDFSTTRRITNTAEQERGVSFSKDGRELYYSSERNGCWSIYKSSLKRKDDKYFTYATEIKEERVSPEGETSFQVEVSPDGKWLAYLRNRTELVVLSTKGGKPKSLHKDVNYSYQDGDQSFSWSPDSRFLLCNWQADGGWNNEDIALVNIDNGEITNLTRSGYSDGSFRWALGGKAMTWESDKNGYRSHGSWGAQGDIYIMFFEGKAYNQFGRDKEQKEIDKMLMGEKAVEKAEKKEKKDSIDKKVEKLELDLANRDDRIRRLTRFSNTLGDHYLTEDGTKLYFTQRLEKGYDLCCWDMEKGEITVVKKGVSGRFYPSPDGKYLFLFSGSNITRLTFQGNKTDLVTFTGDYEFKPQAERTYIFEHCWKQVKEKFYDPALHGTDWDYYHENYARFVPHINNDFDFADMLSEMLGELNGSHTGCRYRPTVGRTMGHLGVLYDTEYKGDGLRIAEVLPGGVLSNMDADIQAGDVITAIEGHEIQAGENWLQYLYDRAGKKTVLRIRSGHKDKELIVTPANTDIPLLYRRWVRQREEMVDRLSGGRVGYVHIEGMDSKSFRELYSKALGRYRNCEALIVDTRHNGGGWLHDDLVTFLGGREYCLFTPRGQYIGHEPFNKWTKPSCVLMGEDNYSDASGFPYAYRSLGLGKLIGAPVPGTMTAVWWESQINGLLVFGIPQVGNYAVKDQCYLENFQIEPDILVLNTPAATLSGRDLQLEAAVAEMLKQIAE
ncbi:MAG: PD40 domain-containing protein [Bacteroidales bacterium]|nr:PD40 domain-containing protein [Bacteroidales bacterium]